MPPRASSSDICEAGREEGRVHAVCAKRPSTWWINNNIWSVKERAENQARTPRWEVLPKELSFAAAAGKRKRARMRTAAIRNIEWYERFL